MPPSTLRQVRVDAGVGGHGVDDVAGLVADRLEGRPRQVGVGVEPGQPDDRPARVAAPVGSEQAAEGRHEVDPAGVLDLSGERLDLGRAGDDPELVAQPLHRAAGDRDRALQRVDRPGVAEAVGDGGEQSVLAAHELLARVEQEEVAGAVGVLGLAGLEAHLAHGGGLLVAEDTGDRDRVAATRRRSSCRTRWSRCSSRSSAASARGMPKKPRSSSSQSRVVRSMSIVRLAFVTSVAWTPPSGPPVRFHTTQVSGVPKRASPRSAASRSPSTCSSIHWTLPAEK